MSKELKEKLILYKKYVDNYKGTIVQKKIAFEAAKEFIKRYGEGYELEPEIQYLKKAILLLERDIAIEKQTKQ